MKEKHKRRFGRLAACGIALAVALPLGGCGQDSGSDSAKIAVIGQSDGIQFWDLVEQGAREASEELGYNVTYANAESITDIDGQIKLINDAVANDADVIVIAPNDPLKINEALRSAVEKDISVITIDAESSYEQIASYIGTDNSSAGAIAGRKAYEYLEARAAGGALGKIGIIEHSDEALSAVQRVSGFQSALANIQSNLVTNAAANGGGTQGGPPAGADQETQGGPPAGADEETQGGPPAGVDETQGGPPAGVDETQGGPPAGVDETQGGPPADAGDEAQGGTQGKGDPSTVAAVAEIVTEATAAAVQRGDNPGVVAQAISAAATQAGAEGRDPVAAAREVAEQYAQGNTEQSELIADIQNCESNTDKAKEQTLAMLRANPDIQLIFATNERSTVGACEAIEAYKEENPTRVVGVIGFNSNDSEINYLRTGTLTGTVVQNPYNMGFFGVYYAGQSYNKGNVPKTFDTGAVYVTVDNLDDTEIQLLLDPASFSKKGGKG